MSRHYSGLIICFILLNYLFKLRCRYNLHPFYTHIHYIIFFWSLTSSQGWPQTHHVAQADLEFDFPAPTFCCPYFRDTGKDWYPLPARTTKPATLNLDLNWSACTSNHLFLKNGGEMWNTIFKDVLYITFLKFVFLSVMYSYGLSTWMPSTQCRPDRNQELPWNGAPSPETQND